MTTPERGHRVAQRTAKWLCTALLACCLNSSLGCSSGGYGFRWLRQSWHPCVPCRAYPLLVYEELGDVVPHDRCPDATEDPTLTQHEPEHIPPGVPERKLLLPVQVLE